MVRGNGSARAEMSVNAAARPNTIRIRMRRGPLRDTLDDDLSRSPSPKSATPGIGIRGLQRFRRQLQLFRHAREIEQGRGLHLAHHLAAVGLHRDLTDAHLATTLPLSPTLPHLPHHLPLAAPHPP